MWPPGAVRWPGSPAWSVAAGRSRSCSSADDLDGPRAEQYGYVNRLIADDELDDEVEAIASRLARFDHDAIARTKSYVDQVTLPADSELGPPLDDFRELFGRPAQQAQWARLQALGLNTDSDLERSLGRRVVEVDFRTSELRPGRSSESELGSARGQLAGGSRIPSLANTLRRCHSTVRGLRKSRAPISGFDSPSRASCAICRSCAVRSSRASCGPLADRPAGRRQLAAGALGKRLHPDRREHLVRVAQLLAGVNAAILATQPLAVEQVSAGKLRPQPRAA